MKSSGSGFKSESNKNITVEFNLWTESLTKVDDLIYNGLTTLVHVCLKSKVNIFSVKISLKNKKYMIVSNLIQFYMLSTGESMIYI